MRLNITTVSAPWTPEDKDLPRTELSSCRLSSWQISQPVAGKAPAAVQRAARTPQQERKRAWDVIYVQSKTKYDSPWALEDSDRYHWTIAQRIVPLQAAIPHDSSVDHPNYPVTSEDKETRQ
jgi:hypothetical protein